MKEHHYKELIGYASAFVSFVLPKAEVNEIILFGSVARGDFDKDSDVDIFFNVKSEEEGTRKILNEELKKFYKSKVGELLNLKGVSNQIKIEAGNLDEWRLKRSVISDGIVLYGKYKSMPEKVKGYVQFNLKPIKNITKRNKIIRALFGRAEENYTTKGKIFEVQGKKLTPSSFLVPAEKVQDILKLLQSEKLDFSFFELWTDQI